MKAAKLVNGNTPLHEAVIRQLEDVVRYLVEEEHADVNARNDNSDTPLHLAAARESTPISQCLIGAGAKVNAMNRDGNAPLHNAARYGQVAQIDILLDAKHPIDYRNDRLETPLMIGIKAGHTPVVAKLVKRGANVNAVDKFGD